MQRVFLHKEGMVRFGTEKYTPDTDLTNLYSHLTNACVHSTAPPDACGCLLCLTLLGTMPARAWGLAVAAQVHQQALGHVSKRQG